MQDEEADDVLIEEEDSDFEEEETKTKKRKTITSKYFNKKTEQKSNGIITKGKKPTNKDDIEDIEDLISTPHKTSLHNFKNDEEILSIRDDLIRWYEKNKRDLPWRIDPPKLGSSSDSETLNIKAYRVWVSEIMLQQTRVSTVIEYFNKWIKRWPTVQSLSEATLEEVNESWAGLGYYRRARFLYEGSKYIVNECKGVIPSSIEKLILVPGIGKYTAGAISSIAFSIPTPLVDGNVIRVISRLRVIGASPKNSKADKLIWNLTGLLVSTSSAPFNVSSFNQGLMELGATICTPTSPNCKLCPINKYCIAYQDSIGNSQPSASVSKPEQCSVCEGWTKEEMEINLVTKYPRKAIKKEPRKETVFVCILKQAGETNKGKTENENENENENESEKYFLVQRANEGLLASLWEAPSIIVDSNEKRYEKDMDGFLTGLLDLSVYNVEKRTRIGETFHIFSHIHQTLVVECMTITLKGVGNEKKESAKGKGKDKEKGKGKDKEKEKNATKWVKEEELSSLAISTQMKKCFALLKDAPPKKKKSKVDLSQPSITELFKKNVPKK